jgi:hypothetical protein
MAPKPKSNHTVNSSIQKGIKNHYSVFQTDSRSIRKSVSKVPAAKGKKQLISTSTNTTDKHRTGFACQHLPPYQRSNKERKLKQKIKTKRRQRPTPETSVSLGSVVTVVQQSQTIQDQLKVHLTHTEHNKLQVKAAGEGEPEVLLYVVKVFPLKHK